MSFLEPTHIDSSFEEKSTVLFRLHLLRILCLLAGVATLPYLFIFRELWLFVTVIALGGYTASLLLTFSNYHKSAKYLLIIMANGHLFVTASAFGRAAGEQLIYIPIIFGAVLVFNIKEKVNLAISIAVSLICIVLLELTDYSLFGNALLPAEPLDLYYGNLAITIVCSVAIAFCYFYLSRLRQAQYLQTIQINREVEKVINYFATSLFLTNTLEEILWDIAKNCIEKFGFVDCVIYLVNDSKTMLVQKAAYGPKNPKGFEIDAPIEIPVGEGIVGSVAATGRAEIIADTSNDSRYIIDDAVRLSEITVPLIYQDEVIGIIDLEHPEKNFFQPKHLSILQTIAALASNKIVATMAEEEQRKAERIQREAEKLKEIDQLKSRFFANISHEFRTPLTLILSPIKEMEAGRYTGDPKPIYNMIKRHGQRLLHLVNQLLDLSKIESGKMNLQMKKMNLVAVLKSVAAVYESLAATRNTHFTLESAGNSIPLYVDPDKLEKILHNLLSNAFKFTQEGGKISLQATTDVIEDKRYAKIEVKDTGEGIASDQLDKIFDRFYRADSSHTRKNEGTGIGLALVRELVELHKGRISVTSTKGEGSCFTVHLPLGKAHLSEDVIVTGSSAPTGEPGKLDYLLPDQEGAASSFSPALQERDRSAGDKADTPHLLVVEDNTDMRQYISHTLDPYYYIAEASHGSEGWEKAREMIPDLVISDVMMPEMDGLEFCSKLKQDERTSHIPVILLTAKAAKTDKMEGLETGADDYLAKPFDADELLILIRNRIDQRNRLRERFSREITLQPKEIAITSADERFLQKATDIVEEHIDDFDFSVQAFVDQMHLGHTQVNRKLKALTDFTPVQFIRFIRLKRAAQKILRQENTISQIAYSVGFNNLSYFAKCFKEQFGQSPSDYSGE